jgi:ABC-type antimicrobial peptide transport system permease subunit
MVTHNPDLANKYATRIVTLKDGKITSDSKKYNGKIKTYLDTEEASRKQKKTRMSFFTALNLSLNNLLTKKGRTVLVSFAGSIGIIGIALIMAVSTGFQNYIDKIEEDTLTSYPLALMKESADLTGVLLSITGSSEAEYEEGKLHENQVITSTLGTVSNNDLLSFRDYLDKHYDEVKDDIRLMEYQYNIDPLIYTIDATNTLAKINPTNMFSSLIGETSLLSTYSSMTSIFKQMERENLEEDTKLLAGRYPEKYNEMMVIINNPGEISELLTYSLGFHDTGELDEIMAKILSGEKVDTKREPLELTYDDLLAADLRLMPATDIYKYNVKYNVYEDMSGDKDYMMRIYEKADRLKIVGVGTMNDGIMASGSGIVYLPSLITHIIDKSSQSEIVKKQLDNPTVDVFSDTKFGEEGNDFNFQFSDLVSIDENKLAQAFGVKLDQNAITTKTTEYMTEILNDVTADISPVEEELNNKLTELKTGFMTFMMAKAHEPDFDISKVQEYADEFINTQDFSELESKYEIPESESFSFKTIFKGLLLASFANTPETNLAVEQMIKNLAINLTELSMKKEIASGIMGLTSYLTSSFANSFKVDQNAIIGAFKLNFTEDELSRVVRAMFTKKKSSLSNNLSILGYQDIDDPMEIAVYFTSFDGKTHFMDFLDHYNDLMRSYNQEDKVIDYTDATGILMSSVKTIVDAVSYVLIAFVSISLVVSSIMIGIITYISVYERTKEIGILRAIGASKRNISNIFNAETFIVGLLAGLFGIGISYALIPVINLILHHFTGDIPLYVTLIPTSAIILVILSVILTLIGGIIPARTAAKKDPVEALRSE